MCLVLSNFFLFAQFCVSLFITLCKQQQLLCLLFLYLHSLHKQKQLLDNCSTDLCNGDLQTTITLFKPTTSSHKPDGPFTNSVACFALLFIWQCKQPNECFWRRMFVASSSRDLYKYKHRCFINVVSLLLFVYFVSFILVVFVAVFLFTCLKFFLLVFVVILRSAIICKQVYFFILVAYFYNFNCSIFVTKYFVLYCVSMYGVQGILVG